MASLIKLGIAALLVLGVAVGNAGVGWAGVVTFTVKIDDLTETPTVKVFNDLQQDITTTVPLVLITNSGEFLHFTLPLEGDIPGSVYRDLYEDRLGGTLSDRLLVTVDTDHVDVQFASDPATIAIDAGVFHITPDLVENGLFQSLFFVSGDIDYDFQVRSDVVETPAPATLFLVGFGLAGLGALGWRRKRG